MKEVETIDVVNLHGCVIRDERGEILARLEECGRCIRVERMPACSLGTYLYLLTYLRELGLEVL